MSRHEEAAVTSPPPAYHASAWTKMAPLEKTLTACEELKTQPPELKQQLRVARQGLKEARQGLKLAQERIASIEVREARLVAEEKSGFSSRLEHETLRDLPFIPFVCLMLAFCMLAASLILIYLRREIFAENPRDRLALAARVVFATFWAFLIDMVAQVVLRTAMATTGRHTFARGVFYCMLNARRLALIVVASLLFLLTISFCQNPEAADTTR